MWRGQSLLEIIQDLLATNRGKTLGAALGLAVGLLIILFGFWKTIFVAICILIGYYLGKRLDDGDGPGGWWDRYISGR